MKLENISLLYLINSLDFGGAEKSTIHYANRFANLLQRVSIFSVGGYYLEKGMLDKTINVYNTLKPGMFHFLTNLLTIIRIIKQDEINLIVYHHRKFSIHLFLIAIFFKKLKVIYVAQNYFNDFRNRLLFAHSYVALTKEVSSDLQDYGKKNILIIPHRIEVIEKTTNNNGFNLGYVGRFENYKGINILLNAFKDLSPKYPKIKLIFRGKGKLEILIKQFATENNHANRIIIDSPKVELSEIYKDIGILILPSTKYEGQGIVLIEAMSLGIPVIASNVGGIKSVIKNNQNGLLFNNGDVNDLADKITCLIENEGLRSALIIKGKNDVIHHYNLEDTIKDYSKLFEKLL